MPYRFLEDTAIADIAFEAWGRTLEATFMAAAEATMNVMVENLDAIEPRTRRNLTLDGEELDMLLFNFLQELIFLKDAERLLLRVQDVQIDEEDGHYRIGASAAGEELDPERHEQRVDVKAVTLHQFRLEKSGEGWQTHVILDI